ncbi:MAG: hypothetical protein JJ900_03455 [Rhodospirillales bacterium]|nr:hypothetical protein [Rhodospirillales bacterium]MBO6785882.1 hypothetical protein [Rhodospirillales bacterium]
MLVAAFEVILIGRKVDRETILKRVDGKMTALAKSVADGANPYLVAANATRDYILATLKACGQEERVGLIERIADREFAKPPHIFELISHVNYCLIVLEDDSKPLVPRGSAESFLAEIAAWFANSGKLQRRVIDYFQESTQMHRYNLQQTRLWNERKNKGR